MSEWAISANDQAKYRAIFQSCNPVDGIVGGEAAKVIYRKMMANSRFRIEVSSFALLHVSVLYNAFPAFDIHLTML